MLKVFRSCVSGQFRACRDALASDLRTIGCEVKRQEDSALTPTCLRQRMANNGNDTDTARSTQHAKTLARGRWLP